MSLSVLSAFWRDLVDVCVLEETLWIWDGMVWYGMSSKGVKLVRSREQKGKEERKLLYERSHRTCE